MSFIGILVYTILRKMNMSFFISGISGMAVLVFYCIMSGNPVSALRAMIMFTVKTGAEITGRTYDMPIALSIGAVLLTIFNAKYLTDPGFLLSFGALTGLGVVYPFLKKHFEKICEKRCVKIFLPGVCINLVSFPITSYFFFEVPLYSIFLNLIIIPLMSFVMIFGIAGSLFSVLVPGRFNIFFKICSFIFYIFNKGCTFTGKLPFYRIVTGQISLAGIVIYYMILLFTGLYILYRKKRCKKVKIRYLLNASAAIFICITLSCPAFRIYTNKTDITVIDVGQGDGIYIRDPYGRNYLSDGGSTDVKNPGKNRIIPFLLSKGVSTLDYCFVSHGDADHKNGLEEIIANQKNTIKVKRLILPDKKFWDDSLTSLYKLAKDNDVKVYTCVPGDVIKNKKFNIEILAPHTNYSGDKGNAASLVFSVNYKDFKMLFTGDLEGEGERALEKDERLSKTDVLKVAHHGSSGSSSDLFLSKTSPKTAIISCGINNRYGHPADAAIKRLKNAGAEIYCTSTDGAVRINTNGKSVKVTTFLH